MSPELKQTPEQIAHDRIDSRLHATGWHVQDKDALDLNSGIGIAVRECQTAIVPADYVLFANRQAIGVIEAKPDSWGAKLTTVEEQSEGYAKAKLKWLANSEPLQFLVMRAKMKGRESKVMCSPCANDRGTGTAARQLEDTRPRDCLMELPTMETRTMFRQISAFPISIQTLPDIGKREGIGRKCLQHNRSDFTMRNRFDAEAS